MTQENRLATKHEIKVGMLIKYSNKAGGKVGDSHFWLITSMPKKEGGGYGALCWSSAELEQTMFFPDLYPKAFIVDDLELKHMVLSVISDSKGTEIHLLERRLHSAHEQLNFIESVLERTTQEQRGRLQNV